MTAHEFARELLDGPDKEVVVRKGEAFLEPVILTTGHRGCDDVPKDTLLIAPYQP